MDRFGHSILASAIAAVLTVAGCGQAQSAELSVRTVQEGQATAAAAGSTPRVIHSIGSVEPSVVIQCPEGTRHVGGPASEIRQIGAGTEQVLSPGYRNDCMASGGGPAFVYAGAAQQPHVVEATYTVPLGSHPQIDPATKTCVNRAASAMHLEPSPLYLILAVEGGSLGHVSRNTNGTYDIGPAQINSSWLPVFAHQGITESQLENDLCTNIMASAWIYKRGYDKTHSTLGALALYHSPTPKYQLQYLHRIDKAVVARLAHLQQVNWDESAQ